MAQIYACAFDDIEAGTTPSEIGYIEAGVTCAAVNSGFVCIAGYERVTCGPDIEETGYIVRTDEVHLVVGVLAENLSLGGVENYVVDSGFVDTFQSGFD